MRRGKMSKSEALKVIDEINKIFDTYIKNIKKITSKK